MIRTLIKQCVHQKRIQNLNSDLWILSVADRGDTTEVVVFNRLFDQSDFSAIQFMSPYREFIPQFQEKIEENQYRCVIDGRMDDIFWVNAYHCEGNPVRADGFKPFRLETDALTENEVQYLKKSVRGFEVYPLFSLRTWQCMCSYVNQEAIICKRCGTSRYQNLLFLEGGYRIDMLKEAIQHAIQHEIPYETAIIDISEQFKYSRHDVEQEYEILVQHQMPYSNQTHSLKRKRNPKWMILAFVSAIAVSGFLIFQPNLAEYMRYYRADRMIQERNYEAARAIYREFMDYQSSRRKFIESYFQEIEWLLNSESENYEDDIYDPLYTLSSYLYGEEQSVENDRLIYEFAKKYMIKFSNNHQFEMALMIGIWFVGQEDEAFTDIVNQTYEYFIEHQDYKNLIDYWILFSDYEDPNYASYIIKFIEKDYMTMLETASPSYVLSQYYDLSIQSYLFELMKSNSKEYYSSVYEILYQTVVKTSDIVTMSTEMGYLYAADYKDSRSRFSNPMNTFYSYTVNGIAPVDANYKPNSIYIKISPETETVTLEIVPIGDSVNEGMGYVYTSDILGQYEIPVDLNPYETTVISLDLQDLNIQSSYQVIDIWIAMYNGDIVANISIYVDIDDSSI